MATPDQPGTIERPTRARYIVLALLCAMAFVLYLDRICMGQAVKPIRDTLDISKFRMGLILAAFTVAYGIFEIPAGHWGDRYGSRRVLARIVICWSLFTALTGASFDFWSLLAVRFLFGAGEAGAFPNAARIFQRWFPPSERGRGQGLMLASSMIGASIAPAVAGELINAVGWRWMFVIFSATGIAWAAVFFWWFHDDPREHPSVNAAEVAEIGIGAAACREHPPIPWHATSISVLRSDGLHFPRRHGIDDCAFPQALEVDYVRVYCRADMPDSQLNDEVCLARPSGVFPAFHMSHMSRGLCKHGTAVVLQERRAADRRGPFCSQCLFVIRIAGPTQVTLWLSRDRNGD